MAIYLALVRTYLRPSYVIALATLGHPEAAEIVAKDVLRKALRELATYGEPSELSSRLFTKVRERARECLGRWGKCGAAYALPSGGKASSCRERDRLVVALSVLDTSRREIVLLHDLAGWSHGQVAGALGIGEEDSRRQLAEARTILRDGLGNASGQTQ